MEERRGEERTQGPREGNNEGMDMMKEESKTREGHMRRQRMKSQRCEGETEGCMKEKEVK